MITNASAKPEPQPLTCPVCGKSFLASASKSMPFCSERCQMIDLGKWLGEDYGLPIEGQEDTEGPFDDAL